MVMNLAMSVCEDALGMQTSKRELLIGSSGEADLGCGRRFDKA
jgi:hypothetical protein